MYNPDERRGFRERRLAQISKFEYFLLPQLGDEPCLVHGNTHGLVFRTDSHHVPLQHYALPSCTCDVSGVSAARLPRMQKEAGIRFAEERHRWPYEADPTVLALSELDVECMAIARLDSFVEARARIQRLEYNLSQPGFTDRDRAVLREFKAELLRQDPAYIDGLALISAEVERRPGALQSELLKGLPPESADAVRFVLYCAADFGDLVRIKSGRSYRLYLPRQEVPPDASPR